MDFRTEVREMARKAKEASHRLAQLSTAIKNKALLEMAEDLERNQELLDQREPKGSYCWGKGTSFFSIDRPLKIDAYGHPWDGRGASGSGPSS